MIVINETLFIEMAKKRGYSVESIQPCILKKYTNNNILVDDTHESFPRPKNITYQQYLETIKYKSNNFNNISSIENETIKHGVGTELKKLLKMIGITSTPNCSCNAKAKVMNQNGIEWCKNNIDTIVGWLKEEAEKRNLPFFTYGAKKLVKLAISRAENAKSS